MTSAMTSPNDIGNDVTEWPEPPRPLDYCNIPGAGDVTVVFVGNSVVIRIIISKVMFVSIWTWNTTNPDVTAAWLSGQDVGVWLADFP